MLLFFSSHFKISRVRSQQRANSQTSNLPPNPHILPRHRSTAELRVVGIETSRTESLTEEPSPGLNNLAVYVPSTHPRNVYQSLHWRNSFTQRVLSEKKGTAVHRSTAVIAHGFWLHIGSIPWATSTRHTSQLPLRRGASRTARNLFTPLPHRL